MLGFLRPKSKKDKLENKYKKLLEEAFKLSHTNRTASDQKMAEANKLLREIEKLENNN